MKITNLFFIILLATFWLKQYSVFLFILAFMDSSTRRPSGQKYTNQKENQDESYVQVKVFIHKNSKRTNLIKINYFLESINAWY